MNSNMDTSGIPLTQEAISQTLNDMVKKKSIKLESEDTESKKSKRKSEKARELSAAEKFNQFKKQRIEKKGEGDIVDDLFKDFIAKKMKEIDAERGQGHSHGEGKSKGAKSVQDFSKILDKELKHISYVQPTTSETGVKSEVNIKTEKDAFPSVIPLPGEPNSVVTVKKEPEELVFQGPSLPPLNKGDDDDVGDMELPVSDAVKSEPKKTAIGFKNFGIKLSLTSTELIKSGDTHKNGKRLEEGEVMSSHSEASSSSSEDEGDDDGDDGEVSGTGSVSDSEGKDKSKKKKRKKKMKHKKKKKHKGKDGEKEDVVLVVKEDKNSSKRKVSITPKSRSKSPKKHKRSRSRSRSKERRKRSRSRSRRRSRSHSKSRRRSRSGSRTRSKHRRSRSRSRHRRSRSGSRSRRRRSRSRSRRDRSPTPERFWRSRYGHFDAFRYMRDKERHRSRSRSRTPDKESDRFIAKEKKRLEDLRLKIDKAKLREIAIKNAVEMAKTGVGPNVDVTYKSGGKSVEELTDFCKRISNKHPKPFPEDSSSDEDTTQRPVSDDDELIHHPFKMKEAPIVMDIRNAKQLPVVSPADRLIKTGELRLQFPVSSGSQHRQKEWVPVEKPGPAKPGFITAPSSEPNTTEGAQATPTPVPPEDKVFEEAPQEPVDISSIISERLSAVRKLAENPHDLGAKLVLDQAQKKASQWANSRMLPGAFIGSTGANVLSHEELIGPNKKRQAWLKKMRRKQRLRKRKFNERFSTVVVKKLLLRSLNIARKDVFTSAAPVKSGIGMLLLQKMGWKHGEGIGKNNQGSVEPLQLDVKVDRKGLLTHGEGKKGGGAQAPKLPPIRDLSGKHPVSALVELCNKRKWGPPQFDFIFECGPDHKKNFLCKVKVNGKEYQPSIASINKKHAKAQAATVCLQEFGLVPRDGPI